MLSGLALLFTLYGAAEFKTNPPADSAFRLPPSAPRADKSLRGFRRTAVVRIDSERGTCEEIPVATPEPGEREGRLTEREKVYLGHILREPGEFRDRAVGHLAARLFDGGSVPEPVDALVEAVDAVPEAEAFREHAKNYLAIARFMAGLSRGEPKDDHGFTYPEKLALELFSYDIFSIGPDLAEDQSLWRSRGLAWHVVPGDSPEEASAISGFLATASQDPGRVGADRVLTAAKALLRARGVPFRPAKLAGKESAIVIDGDDGSELEEFARRTRRLFGVPLIYSPEHLRRDRSLAAFSASDALYLPDAAILAGKPENSTWHEVVHGYAERLRSRRKNSFLHLEFTTLDGSPRFYGKRLPAEELAAWIYPISVTALNYERRYRGGADEAALTDVLKGMEANSQISELLAYQLYYGLDHLLRGPLDISASGHSAFHATAGRFEARFPLFLAGESRHGSLGAFPPGFEEQDEPGLEPAERARRLDDARRAYALAYLGEIRDWARGVPAACVRFRQTLKAAGPHPEPLVVRRAARDLFAAMLGPEADFNGLRLRTWVDLRRDAEAMPPLRGLDRLTPGGRGLLDEAIRGLHVRGWSGLAAVLAGAKKEPEGAEPLRAFLPALSENLRRYRSHSPLDGGGRASVLKAIYGLASSDEEAAAYAALTEPEGRDNFSDLMPVVVEAEAAQGEVHWDRLQRRLRLIYANSRRHGSLADYLEDALSAQWRRYLSDRERSVYARLLWRERWDGGRRREAIWAGPFAVTWRELAARAAFFTRSPGLRRGP